MKFAILSDSHDHLRNLRWAIEEIKKEKVDAILHAGDFVAPFTIDVLKEAGAPVHAVYGNCDGEREGLKKRFEELPEGSSINTEPHILEFDKFTVALMHRPNWVKAFAQSEVDMVVFGHLHEIYIENKPPWVINPGEIFGQRSDSGPSLVFFDTEVGRPVVVRLKELYS